MKEAAGAEALLPAGVVPHLAGVVARMCGAVGAAMTGVVVDPREAASGVAEAVGSREGEYYFSNNCAYNPNVSYGVVSFRQISLRPWIRACWINPRTRWCSP